MPTASTDGQAAALSSSEMVSSNLQFDYIKSNYFRVIHADGAIGSITPSGMIHMALYNERPAIPKSVTHQRGGETGLGEVVETNVRAGFVRELEIDAFITPTMAESLVAWLTDRIEELRIKSEQAKDRVSTEIF